MIKWFTWWPRCWSEIFWMLWIPYWHRWYVKNSCNKIRNALFSSEIINNLGHCSTRNNFIRDSRSIIAWYTWSVANGGQIVDDVPLGIQLALWTLLLTCCGERLFEVLLMMPCLPINGCLPVALEVACGWLAIDAAWGRLAIDFRVMRRAVRTWLWQTILLW